MNRSYSRPKTQQWLEGIGSFENLIDWMEIKGIFVDEAYNVYDLKSIDAKILTDYWKLSRYQEQWSETYYNNLITKIDLYHENMDMF